MLSDDFVPAATGVGTHVQAVSSLLAARGHRITVVTTRRPGEPEYERWQGVDVVRVPTRKVAGFYQALPGRPLLERVLAQVQPDIVHHHYLGMMLLTGMRLARRHGLPQILTYHMTEDHLTQPWPLRPARPLIARGIVAVANRMDLVISVSSQLAATLPPKGIRTPIQTISNPVVFGDADAVSPSPRDGSFVVLFAGRLNPEKNIPLLLRAFAALAQERRDAVLWIAGRGSQQEALTALAAELNVGSQVRFLGFLDHDELARRYAACDVFVLPSLVETQGLVAMEAMWFGKPVVLADSIVSAPELVDEGVNGHVVDHRDPAAMTKALATLAADPQHRARMGAAGRAKAEGWEPEPVVDALEQAYLGLLARHASKS